MFYLVRGSVYLLVVLGVSFSFLYTGLVTIFTYIVLIFDIYILHCTYLWYIYIYDVCLLHLSLHVLFLLSLYTCFFMYAIFISVSHMIPWWVLFNCFRKTGCKSLLCHELSSCKFFEEFMLGLDLFCNSTSGYEFCVLKLLSWFIFLLWFCHRLPKGKIVKDIFYVIG